VKRAFFDLKVRKMQMFRSVRRTGFAIGIVVAVCASAVADDNYPSRIIQIVNPYEAGGTTDVLARGLAVGISSRLGQQAIVINKPGAAGTLGTASVVRARPDGYTLLFAPVVVLSVASQTRPRSEIGYNADSLMPVCQTFSNVMGLVVRTESPFINVADLVSAARAKPDLLTYGHQGVSSIPQLAIEEFLEAAKLKVTGVPFRGDPAVMTDLMGGRIDFAAVVLGVVSGMEKNVRLLGIFADERHPSFPDVPTVTEQGFNVAPRSFGGLFAPKGTPQAIIGKLATACDGAAHDEFYRQAAKRAAQPVKYFADQATFEQRLKEDIGSKERLFKRLGQTAAN
jgi:tripartite-type tricarboxylate transporter receptor subunit TctC